jgi:hypothetical protein
MHNNLKKVIANFGLTVFFKVFTEVSFLLLIMADVSGEYLMAGPPIL